MTETRSRLRTAAGIALAAAAFAAGFWAAGRGNAPSAARGEREVLYWVDPMNPSFRSPEPGTAPCGMPLEPVYADGGGPAPPGFVSVRPDRQQTIGLKSEPVSRRSGVKTLRLPGRVATDEARLFRIVSVAEGWVRSLGPSETGSRVERDAVLATYFSQETLGAQQSYIYALESLERFVKGGTATREQIELNERNARNARQTLLNLGMSETQADAIAAARETSSLLEIRSPTAGFVLERNVSLGQRIDRSTALFTIADLRRVWILADALEADVLSLRPGLEVRVRPAGRTEVLDANVGRALPLFDAATRTFKVRLEADNAGLLLRPGMLVDVEVAVEMPEALTVPASAILDQGRRKSVFLDRGEGLFEPRIVTTGWRADDTVEILAGLEEGDRVVVSGQFLLDSESRMRMPEGPPPAVDPICGMSVDPVAAREKGLVFERDGSTHYFCAQGCKDAFAAKRDDDAR
jgi:Cu(I)/Ag(I) efflux system membrane fusion protein